MTFLAPHDDDGQRATGELGCWVATCNRCGRRRHVSKIRRWFVGRSTTGRMYCPRCKRAVERALIRDALGPWQTFALWRAWAIQKVRTGPQSRWWFLPCGIELLLELLAYVLPAPLHAPAYDAMTVGVLLLAPFAVWWGVSVFLNWRGRHRFALFLRQVWRAIGRQP